MMSAFFNVSLDEGDFPLGAFDEPLVNAPVTFDAKMSEAVVADEEKCALECEERENRSSCCYKRHCCDRQMAVYAPGADAAYDRERCWECREKVPEHKMALKEVVKKPPPMCCPRTHCCSKKAASSPVVTYVAIAIVAFLLICMVMACVAHRTMKSSSPTSPHYRGVTNAAQPYSGGDFAQTMVHPRQNVMATADPRQSTSMGIYPPLDNSFAGQQQFSPNYQDPGYVPYVGDVVKRPL